MASGDRIYLGERDSFTAAELITTPKYKVETVNIPVGSSENTLFNVTGSGLIYIALMSYSQSTSNVINSTFSVDGLTIFNKSISSPEMDDGTGFFCDKGLLNHPYFNALLRPRGSENIVLRGSSMFVAPSTALDTSGYIVYLPKPIRFNNGFKVTGRATVNVSKFTCVYELD